MTGGGRGYCAIPVDEMGRAFGRGAFGGRGGGRGRRNCFYVTGVPGWMRAQRGMRAFGGFSQALSKEDELTMLKNQADLLRGELETVQARVQALAGQQEPENK
jgi:hypothetical protein